MPHRQPPVEHQFKKGQVANPKGRPKDSLKVYLRRKLTGMTEAEKEKWIKGIPKLDQWKMGEGNPESKTDITSKGEAIFNNDQKQAGQKAIKDLLAGDNKQGR